MVKFKHKIKQVSGKTKNLISQNIDDMMKLVFKILTLISRIPKHKKISKQKLSKDLVQ